MARTSAFGRLGGGGSGRTYPGVDGWERITEVTCRIRLVLGIVAIGLTPIVPVSPRRLTWLAFMALVYLPYALAARVGAAAGGSSESVTASPPPPASSVQ